MTEVVVKKYLAKQPLQSHVTCVKENFYAVPSKIEED